MTMTDDDESESKMLIPALHASSLGKCIVTSTPTQIFKPRFHWNNFQFKNLDCLIVSHQKRQLEIEYDRVHGEYTRSIQTFLHLQRHNNRPCMHV